MNIIVTGASNGIGYQTVLELARKENTNILALSRNGKKLLQLQQEAKKTNPSSAVFAFPLDISAYNENLLLKELKEKKFNAVDILINNAGLLINKPFEKLTAEDWMDVYRVNVFGAAQLIKTLLPLMGKKSKTHIVNISSYGGFQGSTKFPGLAAYSSSKAALANLTECLAEEFKDKNISVNCLALGAVQTEMLGKAFPGYEAPTSPAQMAQFITEFATNGHHYFNGKILPVTLSTI
ncbi:MAG: SDR family oxidoreductase [Bacteroidia bacterium]